MNRRTFLAWAIAGSSLPAYASFQTSTPQQDPLGELPVWMDVAPVPGAWVSRLERGKIVWEHGFGVRNADTGQPVDATTIFEAASLTKQVTAYVAHLFHSAGLLDFDKPLNDYVPDMSPLAQRLARRCWPGPVTLVVDDRHPESLLRQLPESVQKVVSPEHTVGLRVPGQPPRCETERWQSCHRRPPPQVRRTPGISCEAVPASNRDGAGMRRHAHPRNHAAESFASFIALFGRAQHLRARPSIANTATQVRMLPLRRTHR